MFVSETDEISIRVHCDDNQNKNGSDDQFDNENSINGDCKDNQNKNNCENQFDTLSKKIDEIINSINILNIKITIKNKMFEICENLLLTVSELNKSCINAKTDSAIEVIDTCYDFVHNKFKKNSSDARRNNQLNLMTHYVKPLELHISTYWDYVIKKSTIELKSSTFQFVPISETLEKLFTFPKFLKIYLEHNNTHTCENGVFENVCCGENFENCDWFDGEYPDVQIQLAVDDFEPNRALKSKAGIYKTRGIYCSIRNFPTSLNSKLNNIYLVALCFTNDLKGNSDAVYTLWRTITKDLENLNKKGIAIDNGKRIKAVLVNVTYDNLGGNELLGFPESFSARYYCRFCEMPKCECEINIRENIEFLRTKSNYNEHVQMLNSFVENKQKVDLETTRGIKSQCILNELTYFHILINLNVDIMHDLFEGLIPFLLSHIFSLCFKMKILNEDELNSRIQFFSFGILNQDKRPSTININKHNCNQNAIQSYILFIHLPFIFYDIVQTHKSLSDIWGAVTSLLRILQIVLSYRITIDDITRLQEEISIHLSTVIQSFGKLIPKHHILTHYPRIIQKTGPPRHTWMMRYESKHSEFTQVSDRTKSYTNLLKTFANNHQKQLSYHQHSSKFLKEEIVLGRATSLGKIHDEVFLQHVDLLKMSFPNLKKVKVINFLKYNKYTYRPNLFIYQNNVFKQILYVFCCNVDGKNSFSFLCDSYYICGENRFLNSFEIKKILDTAVQLISFDDLGIKNSYEGKILDNKCYVIAETLALPKLK